jgi:hypothetical protein
VRGVVLNLLLVASFSFSSGMLGAGAQQAPPPSTHGQVIISSEGRAGQSSAAPMNSPAEAEAKVEVTDVQRQALTFTAYAFDIKLSARDATAAVRAQITVRNGGSLPLVQLPLQISSSLKWQSIRSGDGPVTFVRHTLRSDADHTGKLNEAVLTLASPLAPKQERSFDVLYTGDLAPDAARLTAIGTPPDVAEHSDWDGIRSDFAGVRGFGNVVWYPVSSVPEALGEGDKLFVAIGKAKLAGDAIRVSFTITEEVYGALPNVAILDGRVVPLTVLINSTDDTLPSIVRCSMPETRLGFATPSFFIARRTPQTGDYLHLFAREQNVPATQAYTTAASMVVPQLRQWLGSHPRSELAVLDLPETDDAPFEEGQALFTGLQSIDPQRITAAMSHSLTHAFFVSPRAWLNEGMAQFMSSLWIESTQGRQAAITQLDNLRSSLALAEPAEPDGGPDTNSAESLLAASNPVYYRTKATYVLLMLRELVGDDALAAALHNYDPAADTTDTYFERLIEASSGKKLDWFFADWVYRDRGLPDLKIDNVTPSKAARADSYIVAVTVANDGYASAEVPVTVTSAVTTVTERLLVPARSHATHRVLVQGQPEEVQVNDGTVPEVEASVHRHSLDYTPPA